MPPPRRRRPVQPATRVRLPRSARPRTGPAAEPGRAGWPEDANGRPAEIAAAENGNGHPADPATGETALGAAGLGTVAAEEAAAGTADEPETGTGTTAVEEAPAGDEPDEATDQDEPAGAGRDAGGDKADAGREPMLLPVCLQVVAVILGGLAVWFALKSGGAASPSSAFGGPAGANVAVLNQSATAQVNRQIDGAVDTVFSYSYADTAKTARAARNLLTGRASQEYATLFKAVEQQAPAEKLVLTTTVTNSGVEMLSGDTARLLIFANQQDTATATHSTTDAGAMFSVTALRQGGRWKIEDIDTFSAGG